MDSTRNRRKSPATALQIAKTAAKIALDKKADDIDVLDMRHVVNFCDYFVIATGNSTRQAQAIAQGIADEFAAMSIKANRQEGLQEGLWVLVDFGSVVVHVFERETREFYRLDRLWQDAKPINWKR